MFHFLISNINVFFPFRYRSCSMLRSPSVQVIRISFESYCPSLKIKKLTPVLHYIYLNEKAFFNHRGLLDFEISV